jgi:dolichol kinase
MAGTVAMFLGSFLMTFLILWIFIRAGIFSLSFELITGRIVLLSILAAMIETVPVKDFDNLSVPGVVVLAGLALF